eukprot:GHVR01125796.1.p1 GENE.GHVR01125796.1~~GHVR01125796.1.p1  ORF type:complete len:141 (+),score=14.95 GHVR01125796.1:42-464(+)
MIIVKRVNKEEYQTCLMIRRKVFVEGQKVPAEIESDAFEHASIHFLAFYDNEPAATGRLRVEKSFIKFERVATLEMFRGRGIASKLMEEMQRTCKEIYSAFQMMMHAQIQSMDFYLKLGWTPIEERFYEAGIEHQKMIFS